MPRLRMRLLWGMACLTCLVAGTGVAAPPRTPVPVSPPGGNSKVTTQPIFIRIPTDPEAGHPTVPIAPAQFARFRQAQALHQSGQLEHARDLLVVLAKEIPHQTFVLTELAQVHLEMNQPAAAVALARAERGATRDSVLLGHELALALERTGHPKDAAAAVLETWVASAAEAEWGTATLVRLAPTDLRGIRDLTRRAFDKSGGRGDIGVGLARLDAMAGDTEVALRTLATADHAPHQPPWRDLFADGLLATGTERDTALAVEALVALTGDATQPIPLRMQVAHRTWSLVTARGTEGAYAPRLHQALRDVPTPRWDADLLVAIARGLRQSGKTDDARTLLDARGQDPVLQNTVTLEKALADLRDGPAERALTALSAASQASFEARFRYAEALFFAGRADSSLTIYQEIAHQTHGPYAGAALERIYLIEDADPKSALSAFGRMEYADWRGEHAVATAVAESLYHTIPRGPMWAQAALSLSVRREAAGDARSALGPMLAVADSLPEDRLASVARQRAGDLLIKLKDEPHALAQYEECLARYPRAWNAAEIRRRVEQLRRRL